jgi:hypothetical protein
MDEKKPLGFSHRMGVAESIILSLVTCGIYNAYWNYRQFGAMNALLGRDEYQFAKWMILTLVTCGIYHVYTEYRMGQDLQGYLREHKLETNPNLATTGLVLSCFGMTILCDAIYQYEINKLCE